MLEGEKERPREWKGKEGQARHSERHSGRKERKAEAVKDRRRKGGKGNQSNGRRAGNQPVIPSMVRGIQQRARCIAHSPTPNTGLPPGKS